MPLEAEAQDGGCLMEEGLGLGGIKIGKNRPDVFLEASNDADRLAGVIAGRQEDLGLQEADQHRPLTSALAIMVLISPAAGTRPEQTTFPSMTNPGVARIG